MDTAPYSEAARRLLRPEDCALAVIDIQEKLLPPIFEKERLVRNAALLVFEHLQPGQATVGFEVCIKHVAAAGEGARCSVRATLREVVDDRKLRFDVEVAEGDRTLGVGTHERRVISVPDSPPSP